QGEEDVGRAGEAQAVLDAVGGAAIVGDKAVGEAKTGALRHFVEVAGLEACEQRLDPFDGVGAGLAEGKGVHAVIAPQQGFVRSNMTTQEIGVGNAEVVVMNMEDGKLLVKSLYF